MNDYTPAQLAAAARSEEERLLWIAKRLHTAKQPDTVTLQQWGKEIEGAVETLRACRRQLEALK
jgi:hypothetical protein